MVSEAQKRAVKEYRKKTKKLQLEFSPAEMELWEHIQIQENKQGYIKSLIRKDIQRGE